VDHILLAISNEKEIVEALSKAGLTPEVFQQHVREVGSSFGLSSRL
jgi:hypothetical protein